MKNNTDTKEFSITTSWFYKKTFKLNRSVVHLPIDSKLTFKGQPDNCETVPLIEVSMIVIWWLWTGGGGGGENTGWNWVGVLIPRKLGVS